MKTSTWLAGAALLAISAVASAHTHLKAAVPAQNSTVNAAPEKITLTFSAPAKVTAITIQKEGGPEQKLTPASADAATEITVPAPKLEPGKYVVNWRVMGADNHVMSGKLNFTVAGGADTAAHAGHDKH
jgi:methionine-rich copper-binding protein CopC